MGEALVIVAIDLFGLLTRARRQLRRRHLPIMRCILDDKRHVTARKLCDRRAVAIEELQLSAWEARSPLSHEPPREPASVPVEAS
jgi:hypothetical protein